VTAAAPTFALAGFLMPTGACRPSSLALSVQPLVFTRRLPGEVYL
jgi:hypothetical protein